MAFQSMPMRMAFSDAFTGQLGSELNDRLVSDMASVGLRSIAGRKANKIKLDAWADAQRAGQGGGFDWGSGLSMLAGGLNMAKGFGLFGGGGKSGMASAFTTKNFQAPDYMSGAGDFSSFFG